MTKLVVNYPNDYELGDDFGWNEKIYKAFFRKKWLFVGFKRVVKEISWSDVLDVSFGQQSLLSIGVIMVKASCVEGHTHVAMWYIKVDCM